MSCNSSFNNTSLKDKTTAQSNRGNDKYSSKVNLKKPSWLRISPPSNKEYYNVKKNINLDNLNTVCREAKCPNISECWSSGTATIMILGDTCTRACRFCSVKTGNPKGVVDKEEPERVATNLARTDLKYVVITCVDRDDLSDGGASIFAETILATRKKKPELKIEVLVSDYRGNQEAINSIIEVAPDVIAHNIETVERTTKEVRDPKASYSQSLQLLKQVKEVNPKIITKSSLMVGLGETMAELEKACLDLRKNNVDVVTFGQYLRPNQKLLPVEKYYSPQEFEQLKMMAKDMGFLFVASGVFVRSSYKAAELFLLGKLQ